MPIGCSDDLMPWNQHNKSGSKEDWLDSKKPYVCHAELNAVLNKNLANIKGCVIYVALFPCNTCAQIIIQSRISEVIYYSDKYHDREEFVASRRMFDMAKVKYRQFRPQKKITIDFELIEKTPGDVPPPLDKSHGTADVNENRHNGSDGNKITSNTSHSDELLQSADSDLPQPGGFHAEASGDSAAETEAHKATCV
ncbi:unnamed protein product [Candidula unifasciata]|uniref:dCMP deaminase n=1 Tax=Candidula unifasciata TaxID=100452 RepID=A0A8S3ZY89_9EUPU|nr:unnamed protein product [Candidula unifasciata]